MSRHPQVSAADGTTPEQLREVGESAGLGALLEAINWGDYEILILRFYDRIEWVGTAMDKDARMEKIRRAVKDAHLARHNNDHDLRKTIAAEGFSAFYTRLVEVRDMFAS